MISKRNTSLFTLIVAALTVTVLTAGCGKSDVQSPATSVPQSAAPNAPAAGPAISDKLTFDQLALDSSVKRVQSSTGPVYLEFKYTDRDGTIYTCRLPERMSEGSFLPDDWVRTFNIYRLPKAVGKKSAPTQPLVKSVDDFPFISPRSATATDQPQAAAPEAPQPAPVQAPLPTPAPPQAGQPYGGREIDYD